MPPARTLTISRPFDARHVSGVNIPGVTTTTLKAVPMPDWDKTFPPASSASASSSAVVNPAAPNSKSKTRQARLEPDEIPTHLNIGAAGKVPKRSQSFAEGLGLGWRKPSLRVRSSMSMGGLRGRGQGRAEARERGRSSGAGAGAGAGEKGEVKKREDEKKRGGMLERSRTSRGSAAAAPARIPDSKGLVRGKETVKEKEKGNVQRSTSMESKRLPRIPTDGDKNPAKKPTERQFESNGLKRGMVEKEKEKENVQQRTSSSTKMESKRLPRPPMDGDKDLARKPTEEKFAPTSSSRASEKPPQLPDVKDLLANRPKSHTMPVTLQPNRGTTNTALAPKTRPKRADSGTAIDFSDVAPKERPLGFKEIQAVESLAERMELYRRTREYWANADHGLVDWMEGVGGKRL